MIRVVGQSALEIVVGVAVVMAGILAMRFGAVPAIADLAGWTEGQEGIARRIAIIIMIALGYWAFVRWTEKRPATEFSWAPVPIFLSGIAGSFIIGLTIALL